jgi:hypothetical protein
MADKLLILALPSFSQSLTHPDVYGFILTKLLLALIGFSRLGATSYTETAHEYTYRQLYDVRHSWYMIP